MTITAEIGRHRIVPVVALERAAEAVPLAKALMEGGLPVVEVTFRSDAAREAIARIAQAVPEMLIGAGTVLSPDQVDDAAAAGARFVVSPGFNARVVERCLERRLAVVPGVNNPTGVEAAIGYGLSVLKFFPAEPSGGLPFIRALAGPYRGVRYVPTGGIGPGNMAAYLAEPAVLAIGGSWLVEPKLIAGERWTEIAELTAEAVAIARGA
jgi:2-dehydro-3-deoxyphosphogluconate aldolase/(4S)-4-hydroxy-2-oxoglutarate aldolase